MDIDVVSAATKKVSADAGLPAGGSLWVAQVFDDLGRSLNERMVDLLVGCAHRQIGGADARLCNRATTTLAAAQRDSVPPVGQRSSKGQPMQTGRARQWTTLCRTISACSSLKSGASRGRRSWQ
jgi:hypothetical protein